MPNRPAALRPSVVGPNAPRKQFRWAAGLGLLAAAFGAGRQTTILDAAPAPPERAAEMDPRAAAEQVSRALQMASADAAQSVVQVRSFRQSRRGRLRPDQEGSGVVVSDDGIVVTNEHVVDGGAQFEVVFTDGSRSRASLVGADSSTDLAVLRIDGELPSPNGQPLRKMPLRTELPPVGELVLAVGNPLSLGHTVTLGVVNGHGRSNLDIAEYENYIQTDAAINPGNSGGPLVDVQGRAIGITVAVGLESNDDGGLAFAIPASMVQRVVDEIVKYGRVRRAYLGVTTYRSWSIERSIAADRESGYTGTSLVKVQDPIDGGPAAKAGVRAGDILLKIGKHPMRGTQTFYNALIESNPDETVEIRLWRGGKELTKSVKLIERQ